MATGVALLNPVGVVGAVAGGVGLTMDIWTDIDNGNADNFFAIVGGSVIGFGLKGTGDFTVNAVKRIQILATEDLKPNKD